MPLPTSYVMFSKYKQPFIKEAEADCERELAANNTADFVSCREALKNLKEWFDDLERH
jgi:hypothetical protein